jgi:hypothetical protein
LKWIDWIKLQAIFNPRPPNCLRTQDRLQCTDTLTGFPPFASHQRDENKRCHRYALTDANSEVVKGFNEAISPLNFSTALLNKLAVIVLALFNVFM